MTKHISEAALNDYVEDLLGATERREVDEHLAVCAACRGEEAGLRATLERLRNLPRKARPERDLWPAVAVRTVRGSGAVKRLRLPAVPSLPPGRTRQLLAASLILGILATGAWLILRILPPEVGVQDAQIEPVRPEIAVADAQFASAVADLERVITSREQFLDPALVRAIHDSLHVIDAALGEQERAREQNPAAEILERQIAENRKRKLNLLRQVASMVQAPV